MEQRNRVTVGILGAGGTIAPAIVRDLAESEEVAALRLLDLDAERAAACAAKFGEGKADARAVDARADLATAIDGCDILVNSASYRINLDAMRACLAAGCHYIDLGGLYWLTGDQLALHDEFASANLLALLGMGSSPGKTNVMAARAARELERVDELHVSASGRDLDPPEGFSVPYALQTIIDELTMQPVVVRDGEPVEIEPLTDGGTVEFPAPIGVQETIYTLHSEVKTFPSSFACRAASFRLALKPELLENFKELIGSTPERIAELQASALPPSARTVAVHIVDALGDDQWVRVSAVTRPMKEWGLGGGVVSTGAPAAAAVRLLAQGKIVAKGVLPPESCLDPDDLFPQLEERGTEFQVEVVQPPTSPTGEQ